MEEPKNVPELQDWMIARLSEVRPDLRQNEVELIAEIALAPPRIQGQV